VRAHPTPGRRRLVGGDAAQGHDQFAAGRRPVGRKIGIQIRQLVRLDAIVDGDVLEALAFGHRVASEVRGVIDNLHAHRSEAAKVVRRERPCCEEMRA